jgi:hypothetical protein
MKETERSAAEGIEGIEGIEYVCIDGREPV